MPRTGGYADTPYRPSSQLVRHVSRSLRLIYAHSAWPYPDTPNLVSGISKPEYVIQGRVVIRWQTKDADPKPFEQNHIGNTTEPAIAISACRGQPLMFRIYRSAVRHTPYVRHC